MIIGAGPIGCEMAQAFHYMGVKVTVLEAFTMMPRDEPELVEMLRSKMIAEGLGFAKKITINEITQSDGRIYISIGSNQNAEMLVGSHLLIAAGTLAQCEKSRAGKCGRHFYPQRYTSECSPAIHQQKSLCYR